MCVRDGSIDFDGTGTRPRQGEAREVLVSNLDSVVVRYRQALRLGTRDTIEGVSQWTIHWNN